MSIPDVRGFCWLRRSFIFCNYGIPLFKEELCCRVYEGGAYVSGSKKSVAQVLRCLPAVCSICVTILADPVMWALLVDLVFNLREL